MLVVLPCFEKEVRQRGYDQALGFVFGNFQQKIIIWGDYFEELFPLASKLELDDQISFASFSLDLEAYCGIESL